MKKLRAAIVLIDDPKEESGWKSMGVYPSIADATSEWSYIFPDNQVRIVELLECDESAEYRRRSPGSFERTKY